MSKGNPYMGIVVDDRTPMDFIIRRYDEPLLPQGYAYQAFKADGTEVFISEPTLGEVVTRLMNTYVVRSIIADKV